MVQLEWLVGGVISSEVFVMVVVCSDIFMLRTILISCYEVYFPFLCELFSAHQLPEILGISTGERRILSDLQF